MALATTKLFIGRVGETMTGTIKIVPRLRAIMTRCVMTIIPAAMGVRTLSRAIDLALALASRRDWGSGNTTAANARVALVVPVVVIHSTPCGSVVTVAVLVSQDG